MLDSGRARDAIGPLRRAADADPSDPRPRAQLARALVMTGDADTAAVEARAALALEPADALTLDTLGVVFSHAREHTNAAEVFRLAVQHNPRHAGFHANLGMALRFCGDLAGAQRAFERAIELEPRQPAARYALANLRRYTADDNHIPELERLYTAYAGDIQGRLQLGYALAKELDDTGDTVRAFAVLSEVNAALREARPYDFSRDRAVFVQLHNTFNETYARTAPPGHDDPAPIFIIGLPRTGTTLTERILSGHTQVHSAGELTYAAQLARQLSGLPGPAALDTTLANRLGCIDPASFGRAYSAAARQSPAAMPSNAPRPSASADAARFSEPYFVDKWPHNFLYAGLILTALPQAKVVCLRRHPLDSCLSNFRQLFAVGNPFYDYSYDLLDCGRYYVQFDRLMRHWARLFPGRILTLQYEKLVEHPEAETRRLLEHCGLEFEAGCLAFERNAAPVATASSAQVREGLYTTAVARWRRYSTELQPLVELLQANGIPLDPD